MSLPSYAQQNLCSRSFKGEKLRGVSFQSARCGVSLHRRFLKAGVSFLGGTLLGLFIFIMTTLNLYVIKNVFLNTFAIPFTDIVWMTSLSILLATLYCIISLLLIYNNIVLAIVAVVAVVGVVVGVAIAGGAVAVAAATAIAVAGVATGAAAIAAAVSGNVAVAGTVAGIVTGTVAGTVAETVATAIYLIFSIILSWRAIQKEDPQLAFIRSFALGFRSWLGTSFVNADLTEADFSHAQLSSTRFNNACLIRANFQHAKKLKFADLKKTILENRAVRELLVTGEGANQSYAGLNLTGAYLRNANLQQADLSQANLLGADLRGANLTGAKIGNWLIDTTTLLDDIQCDYVFLENNKREPPDGFFKAGEFTKLFQQVAKTLAFLVETRLELEALLRAADRLRAQGVNLEFGSVENKQGSAKVTFIADSTFEREELYAEMKREFEHQKLLIAEYNGRLLEKDIQIGTLTGLIETISQRPTTAYISGDYMTDGRTQTITGSTIIGSTLNLGEISGQVQNSVNQLPTTTPEQSDLKETLQRLRQLLTDTKELSDDDKAEALAQLQKIIDAAKEPTAGQGIAKTAIRFFKGLADDVKNAKELASGILGLVTKIGVFFKL